MMPKGASYFRRLPYTRRAEPREDGAGAHYWLAWVEEIPSIEIHGATREEAFERLDEIFDDCVEAMIGAGDEIPEPTLWPSGLLGRAAMRNLRKVRKRARGERTGQTASVEDQRLPGDGLVQPWSQGSPAFEHAEEALTG